MVRRRVDPAAKALRRTTQRHSTAGELDIPDVEQATVVRPETLAGRSGEIWEHFAPDLIAKGMLTGADTMMFAIWCQLAARVEAGKVTSGEIGHFRMISNDFGLSPSGKGRETVIKPVKKNKFFGD